MSNRFQDKVAIVTGGSMGIGRATALQLAREGAQVIACARRRPRLDSLADEIAALGGKFRGVDLDIGDIDAFAALIQNTADEFGRLDILVNNAPTVIGGTIVDQDIDAWRANFGVCVESVFIGVQAALKIMQPQGSGAIINISSVSSLRAGIAAGAYSAAKAAVNQFSMCAAMEAAPYGVRVNVVAPGAVETPGLDASVYKNDAMKALMASSIPIQRLGTPEDLAQSICFLASDEATFITGVVLPVDGGKTPQLHVPDWELTLDNRSAK
ncbi:2,5-dichloro-2,5-cyclohexadiene-1,4-diol dehydrogenase [Halioglobus sp. HI00S01]|uniref:SDR family NAD(P)-dependent oxidoreductase n=1 Tax=Halioglobus sp. HI00S01 TaxID=1822214 RepID=UPI0007C3BFE2|nr:SDR family NAD(P)-dependent oxidoreductase [Halioglobus sp. HI00S01]KZX58955.1 2,5-dichloro-2,5-cyclohexadiene-1,4-diol dehydrogenase [Halioglobus sp. HI00S01]